MVRPFLGRDPGHEDEPILVVRYARKPVLRLHKAEAPCERLFTVELEQSERRLDFVDSHEETTSYDLSSVFQDGARKLFMSVRMGPSLAIQPDCLLSTDGDDPADAFKQGQARGIRMQPFFLPESASPPELAGHGLLFRGLHFSGTITASNTSLLCICDFCRRTFRLQSFHAGFGDLVYFYCSNGPHTLVASRCLVDAPQLLTPPDPQTLARFESRLPACEQCGGRFLYMNPLLCPHCLRPYIDFARYPEERPTEYYGNYLYGQQLQALQP